MADISTIATLCMEDLVAKLKTADAISNKSIITVYTEDDMMDMQSQMHPPCAGVLYEGMRSVPDDDKTKKGLSVELVYSIMLIISGRSVGNPDYKSTAAIYLDQFRNAIKLTRSPSGMFWRFQVEAAVEPRKGAFVYQQRWCTPAVLTA